MNRFKNLTIGALDLNRNRFKSLITMRAAASTEALASDAELAIDVEAAVKSDSASRRSSRKGALLSPTAERDEFEMNDDVDSENAEDGFDEGEDSDDDEFGAFDSDGDEGDDDSEDVGAAIINEQRRKLRMTIEAGQQRGKTQDGHALWAKNTESMHAWVRMQELEINDAFGIPASRARHILKLFGYDLQRTTEQLGHCFDSVLRRAGLTEPPRERSSSSSAAAGADAMEADEETFTCPTCFDERPISEAFTDLSCAHQFCRFCWLTHLKVAAGSKNDLVGIKCMDQGCTSFLSEEHIFNLVDASGAIITNERVRFEAERDAAAAAIAAMVPPRSAQKKRKAAKGRGRAKGRAAKRSKGKAGKAKAAKAAKAAAAAAASTKDAPAFVEAEESLVVPTLPPRAELLIKYREWIVDFAVQSNAERFKYCRNHSCSVVLDVPAFQASLAASSASASASSSSSSSSAAASSSSSSSSSSSAASSSYSSAPSKRANWMLSCPDCSTSLCWSCKKEGHTPCSCEQVAGWEEMSSAENAESRLKAKCKECPKCGMGCYIDDKTACNHMTCHCKHEWCWMCGGDWFPIHGSSFYECNVFKSRSKTTLKKAAAATAAADAEGDGDGDGDDDYDGVDGEVDDVEKSKAKERKRIEALETGARYQHYFDRYDLQNLGSTDRAAAHLRDTVEEKTRVYSEKIGLTRLQLDFAEVAANRVLAARRALKWSFALLFYMEEDEEDMARNLFQHHQSKLQHHAEELHKFLTEGVEKHKTLMAKNRGQKAPAAGGKEGASGGGSGSAPVTSVVHFSYYDDVTESDGWTAQQWQDNFTAWRKCVCEHRDCKCASFAHNASLSLSLSLSLPLAHTQRGAAALDCGAQLHAEDDGLRVPRHYAGRPRSGRRGA